MMRRLRFTGTDSKNGGCPALHDDLDTGEIIVQGQPLTDRDDLAQLQYFGADDAAVVVPRQLLANWAPKETERVPELISPEEFGRLFETFEHTAWHLETRRGYASDREDPDFGAFLSTGRVTWDLDSAWNRNIRDQVDSGKRVGRVRVVDNPPTDGQRFLLGYGAVNVASGEDVGCLWRADAQRISLPEEDFWIFDSRLVAVLHFDEGDVLTSIETITEPAEVVRYSMARDAAVHHAIPYKDFVAQVSATE
ncbi:hypothetical protein DMA15_03405 [Streptomyces sp. WAC 01529]|uniref:DUF6879 family protein n=1 Tax=Streptomyces sp. WAC 01529 TaxID=2203205 RepID=UPI000F6BA8E7|nr:DUF6879 family protein [Streptomyces sp. WAC 01529]AZM51740.1 hypothetical protein DMA15_03405 [Streptomyces sp. WAC 01529]